MDRVTGDVEASGELTGGCTTQPLDSRAKIGAQDQFGWSTSLEAKCHSGKHIAQKYVRPAGPRTSLQRRRFHRGFPCAHNNRICWGDGRSRFPHCNCRKRRTAIIVGNRGLAQNELDLPSPAGRDRDQTNINRAVSNGWMECASDSISRKGRAALRAAGGFNDEGEEISAVGTGQLGPSSQSVSPRCS